MKKSGFLASASYVRTGWRLVRTPGLRRFVMMPLIVNLAIFAGLGWWINSLAAGWLQSLSLFSSLGDWWIINALETLLRWIVSLVLFFSLAYIFTLVANMLGAPFNGLLSERVEAHLTGQTPDQAPGWLTLVKSIPRTILSEFSKLLYLVICIVPLLILQFIPVINLIAPLLLFLFGAWMFALEYMDYPMGNHGALFRDVRRRLRKHRSKAFGFGSAVALLSMVPLVNLVIMPVAVAGATALYVDHLAQTDDVP